MIRCLVVSLSLLVVSAVHADNWPQWRGGNHDGIGKETNLPAEFGPKRNLAWKLDLPGMGSSTPCIWDKHIFFTCEDGDDAVLIAVGTDGKQLWKKKVGKGGRKARGDEGNSASPSPATDGKNVYAFVGAGDFICCDFTGKEVWKFNAQDRYGRFSIMFGMHSTPILHGDRLYMQLIHSSGAWVIAIDKATGKDVWKVRRESDGTDECEHSYASPCLWTDGRKALLVTHGNDYAIGHRLEDGEEVWRVGGLNPKEKYNRTLRFVASPTAVADLIVVPSAKNGPVVAIKPDASGLVMPGNKSEVWRRSSNTPDVPTPLIHDGLVYLCRENGFLICMDAKTGKEKYNERLHPGRYRASPVVCDGKIFLIARDGVVTVVKAGPKFEKLAENKMGEDVTSSPAFAGGRIYIRGFKTLFAFENSAK